MFRRRKQLEIDHDKDSNTFTVFDPNLDYWSSVPFGDVIIDLTKDGRIKGVEILNADKLNININEHEQIVKMLEDKEKNDGSD